MTDTERVDKFKFALSPISPALKMPLYHSTEFLEVIKNKVGLFRRYMLSLKSFKLRFKKLLSKECD